MKTYWIDIQETDTREIFGGTWTGKNKQEAIDKAIAYYAENRMLPPDSFKVINIKA